MWDRNNQLMVQSELGKVFADGNAKILLLLADAGWAVKKYKTCLPVVKLMIQYAPSVHQSTHAICSKYQIELHSFAQLFSWLYYSNLFLE